MEGNEGVGHGGHGDEGEEPSGDLTDLVAEVEEADGEAAEDDGEVEPGEEGALVGEEDFGLDARGERDALACGEIVRERERGREGWKQVPGAVWRRGWEDMAGRIGWLLQLWFLEATLERLTSATVRSGAVQCRWAVKIGLPVAIA